MFISVFITFQISTGFLSYSFGDNFFSDIVLILPLIHFFVVFFIFILNIVLMVSVLRPKGKVLKLKSIKSTKAALRVRELKKLLDEGIISKEVFDEKSKKYIEEL
jgi:hypothetical protein